MKIPVDKDRYIVFDEKTNTATVVVIPELQKVVTYAQERLAEIPQEPTDTELLEWARENHPQAMDYSKEKQYLEAQITEAQQLLEIK